MVDVTIYTRMMCGYCTAAKRLLERKGVAYTEHDASFSPELRQEMISRAHGALDLSADFHRRTHVGGCDDLTSWRPRAGWTGCSPMARQFEEYDDGCFQGRCDPDAFRREPRAQRDRSRTAGARSGGSRCDLHPDAGNDRGADPRQGSARRFLHLRGQGHHCLDRARDWLANSASSCISARPPSCAPTASSPTARCCSARRARRSPPTTRSICSMSISTMASVARIRCLSSRATRAVVTEIA